jgi:hypothetical protein
MARIAMPLFVLPVNPGHKISGGGYSAGNKFVKR